MTVVNKAIALKTPCCRGVGAAWNRSLHTRKIRYLGLSAVTVENRPFHVLTAGH
jgi:hypothetical protein